MTAEHEFDDLARELHAMRAEPRPEYAHELDRRAASWLRERSRRRLPSLRIAIPATAAAAAAAVVVALAISGGGDDERLEVAVIPEGATGGAEQAPQALGEAPRRDSADSTGGAFLLLTTEGETVTVRYLFPAPAKASVELAGSETEVEIGPGSGSLEISTEGLPAGAHELTISTPSAPTYREPVKIGD